MKAIDWSVRVGFACVFAACSSSSSGNSSSYNNDASTYNATLTDGPTETSVAVEAGTSDAALGEAGALTDGQIVAIVEAANTGEIEEADLAIGANPADAGLDASLDAGAARFANPMVSSFAQMMISAHSASNMTVEAFDISPQPSTVQATLQTGAQATISSLEPLAGGAFDLAYVEAQVTAHQTVLGIVQNDLIPSASNADLKTYLVSSLLPTVESHLAMAQSLLAELTDGGLADAGAGAHDGAADAAGE